MTRFRIAAAGWVDPARQPAPESRSARQCWRTAGRDRRTPRHGARVGHAHGMYRVTEQPSPENGWTAVIRVDDAWVDATQAEPVELVVGAIPSE